MDLFYYRFFMGWVEQHATQCSANCLMGYCKWALIFLIHITANKYYLHKKQLIALSPTANGDIIQLSDKNYNIA